jgi:hypothetical protein
LGDEWFAGDYGREYAEIAVEMRNDYLVDRIYVILGSAHLT